MRHRRRINTQTIRKKNITTTTRPTSKASSNKLRNFFIFLTIIIILAVGGLYIFDNIIPLLSLINVVQTTDVEETDIDDSHSFPVEGQQNDPVEQQFSPIQKRIQLEVLNGCGEPGIAKLLSERLKKHNYDVVNSGNYLQKGKENFDVKKTLIIDQISTPENIARSKELADLVGVGYSNVESYENPSPIADITIVIGKDFINLSIFKDNN